MTKPLKRLYEKHIGRRNFLKAVLKIAGGTAAAQLVSFLFMPLISRIYSPAEFGQFSLFVGVLATLGPLASMRYANAFVIAEKKDLAPLVGLSFLLVLGFSTLFFAAWLTVMATAPPLWSSQPLFPYLGMVVLGFFLLGVYEVLYQLCLRDQRYGAIGRRALFQGLTSNVVKVALGWLGVGPIGLMIGHVTSQSSGILALARTNFSLLREIKKDFTWSGLLHAAKFHRNFPLFQLPSSFLLIVSSNLPTFVLAFQYDLVAVGHFGMANLLVRLPVSLVGNSLAAVFLSESARIGPSNPARLLRLSLRLLGRSLLFGVVPLAVFAFFSEPLTLALLGESWRNTSDLISVLAIGSFVTLCSVPLGGIYTVLGLQKAKLVSDSVRIVLTFLSLILPPLFQQDLLATVWVMTIVQSLNTVSVLTGLLLFVRRRARAAASETPGN